MRPFYYHMPVKIHFGNHKLDDAGLYNLPYYKALIVTNRSLSLTESGHLPRLIKQLEQQKIKALVFDEIKHPLTKDTVAKGALTAREFGCDFIIGMGGGKALDAAKLIARFANEDIALFDAWLKSRIVPPFENKPLATLMIPTTLNLSSSVNHKAFVYVTNQEQFIRFKDDSLYPTTAILDPQLLDTLDEQAFYPMIINTLLRAIEILIEDQSIMHRMHALNAFELLLKNAVFAEEKPLDETVLYHLVYSVYTIAGINMPKTLFPLHQISDAIEGYHETLPHSVFTMQGFLPYLDARLERLSDEDEAALLHIFKETPYHSNNLYVALKNFYHCLNLDFCDLKAYGVDLALVTDYIVHLKTLFPSFAALKDDVIYTIIEQTLLKG